MAHSHPPFTQRLLELIESQGPIPMASFMALANSHYYATRDPLGVTGDFITAPEISQIFGELIGLWIADLWLRVGQPPAALVELGPGRGTLMADARRALSHVPGMAGMPVHLVEASPALRAAQARAVPDAHWHDSVATLPVDCALLVIANEFFDALPIRQFIATTGGWRERMVAAQQGGLVPVPGPMPVDPLIPPQLRDMPAGSVVETSPASAAVVEDLGARIAAQGGCALIIDYGYEGPAIGDTLQAVKKHRPADMFATPGEADLTAHVDFAALAAAARRSGCHASGIVAQGALLQSLGIAARAERLKRHNPARAQAVDADVDRLTTPCQMGTLFRALALTAPSWPEPAGF